MKRSGSKMAMAALTATLLLGVGARAQTAPASNAPPTADNAVMITIFFKHDQSRPLSELNAQLERQGFYKAFPPEGVEVVSWYVMMGIGQVVTLRLPASRLREVNRIIENSAWGAYRTEFYPTYDYRRSGSAITTRPSNERLHRRPNSVAAARLPAQRRVDCPRPMRGPESARSAALPGCADPRGARCKAGD